jgi:SNF2 family DNA or RNA helicase
LSNWAETHREKLDALEDIIDDNPGENILVAYNYKSDLERIKIKFPKARVLDKNPQTIQDWNAGKIPLLLAHPQSAGHGLNLQHGGATIVWFGLNWSLELDQQFNGRLHRQGQERPVRVIRIVAAGCLDERVLQVLAIKDAVQSNLLAALKPTGVL